MKLPHLRAVMFLLLAGAATAQTTYVVNRYDERKNITNVHTFRLDVIDGPNQFLQIQFSGAFAAKDTPTSLPFQIKVSIWSFATEPLYRLHSQSKLVAYADDQEVPIGLGIYDVWYSQQTMNSNKRVSSQPFSGAVSMTLPAEASIRKTHKWDDIEKEFLEIEPVSLDTLLRLAQARQVWMQLGHTQFSFPALGLDILRLFIKRITPSDYQSGADKPGHPGVSTPSEASNTPLKQTMEWLKGRLSNLAAVQDYNSRAEFDPKAFARCEFKYTDEKIDDKGGMLNTAPPAPIQRTIQGITPSARDNPGPTVSELSRTPGTFQKREFRVDFADLDPEAVRVLETPTEMVLVYVTNDSELKIKEDSLSDGSYYHWVDKYLYHARTIKMKKDGKAAELREAFVHAIKLCQGLHR